MDVDKMVRKAEEEGAQQAEIVKEHMQLVYVRFELGEPKQTLLRETTEYALRVMVDGAVGFSYFTGGWEEAVKEAISLARTREKDREYSFTPGKPETRVNLYRKSVEDVSVEQIIGDVRTTDEATWGEKIVASNIECQTGHAIVEIANSCGVFKREPVSLTALRVMCRAAEADFGMGYSHAYSLGYDIDFPLKGEEAKEKALSQLKKEKTEPGNKKVILDPRVFSSLLVHACMPSFLGDNVKEGRSSLSVGRKVAAEHVTVKENPLREVVGGRSFDDEGVPSQPVTLIEGGCVQNFLYDTYYGETTGNGIRYSRYRGRSLRDPPRPCATLLTVEGESAPLDELISQVEDGLLVTDETNSHASKPQSGLFSIAVTGGFIIRKGEIASPVKRCMVTGLAFEDLLPCCVLLSRERELNKSAVYPTYAETGHSLVEKLRVIA